ncbi:MAG TPA: carboxypeptidase-like regulatory domain-containing protein [Bryobacteraceae bacterium]|nr:carboxypeptidase-like regulatory domain-containing protein [Bryobacteraceae bacterium]
MKETLSGRGVSAFKRLAVPTFCGLALLASVAAIPVHAQSSIAGTVVGQVQDESGAAVPGVAVKLVEPATGTTFDTVSNDTGRFEFATVPPGKYDINFSKTGFSEYNIRNQEIKIGIVLTANATLKVGSTATTVEVSASVGAELQTMNATVGNTMSQTSLMVLPNLGRDASTMAVLQPATAPGGQAAGAVADLNTYQLDGANITDDMSGNVTTYQTNFTGTGGSQTNGLPSPVIPTPIESIEEFKVSVSNQTADFNNSSGAQIQMTTKRGTSQFHGAAYMFYYDNAIGQANTWANNHTPFTFGSTSFPDTPVDYPKNHRSRFGGALGGPLLPKSFLGGKWFFFANYEGSRFPNAGTYSANVPSAALREGVIQIPNSAGVYLPYNLSNQPVNFNGQVLQPAQCPSGPCDPRGLGMNPIVSQIWNTQIPQPNNPLGGDNYNTLGFLGTIRAPLTTNNYVGRIDHDFGDKEHFYLTYRDYKLVSLTTNQVDIGGVIGNDKLGTPTPLAPRPQQPSVWTAGLVTSITPTLTNTLVFDYLRQFWQWSDAGGPPSLPSLGGALEISGETSSPGFIPYNVNSQSIRQRFWDGQDKWLKDDLTLLKGNHLFGFGGSYGRNFDYHSRSDNGAGVNNQISYLSTNSGVFTSSGTNYIPTTVPSSQYTNYENYYSYVLGIVSSTQVMYTRQLPTLSPLPIGTNATDQSIIPYYSVYFQDTWHMKPSFTLSYGVGWNLEMPPYEINGKQVALVDGSGQPVNVSDFMAQRNKAALAGQVYFPQLGYELVRNVGSGLKYPYNPYYGEFSPHVAFAWNPHYNDGILGKLFGNGKTVIRGGYSRIFGRLNGVDLVLVPLLGPGMLQGATCVNPLSNGSCGGTGVATPATAFRIGTDGLTAPLGAPSATLPQPYYPGGLNPTSVDADTLDPNFKPDRADNFTLTIQRELNQHMSLEVGYVGKIIKNEFQNLNLDSVPINTTLGGQSFANAFGQLYSQLYFNGVLPANVQAQPFFENAMGGANSAYCKGYANCTAAVASATGNASLIKTAAVSDLWNALQSQSSWILGPTTYNTKINGGAAASTSIQLNNSLGWGNYNGVFVSFRTNAWHGITTASNFTWSRALGTATVVQASSSFTALDPFNLGANYGSQGFDYKFVYNTSMYYDVPFFHSQKGVLGHILGGWTIAPLFQAQSGAPWGITWSEGNCSGCEAFGQVTTPGTAALSSNSNQHAENAVGYMPYTGGQSGHYGVAGGTGVNPVFGSNAVGNALHGGINYGTNLWANPAAVYSEFRPCVLGIDTSCGGGAGPLRTLPFWNLDAQIVKNLNIYKEHLGAQFFFTFTNILNHFQPSTPTGSSLTSPTSFGQITGQSNTPRSLEFGLRLHF